MSVTFAADPLSDQDPALHRRKRRRIGYACEICRVRKIRCDGERPSCGQCGEKGQQCIYSQQKPRISVTHDYIEELKSRNEMLARQLAAREGRADPDYQTAAKQSLSTEIDGTEDNPAQASDMATIPDPAPSTVHLINDQHSPRSTATPAATTFVTAQSRDKESNGTPAEFFGESSTFDFLAKVGSPETHTDNTPSAASVTEKGGREPQLSLVASSPSAPIFDNFLIGGQINESFEMPHRSVADRLVEAYFKYRHPLNPYVHEGTFRQRYIRLWISGDVGGEEVTEQNLAWFGLVNLVFSFGSDHAQLPGRMPTDGSRYFKRAKNLVFSGILQTGSIELVQALLLMGQYLHTSLELNSCWTVVGLAIRTAQSLGLHLDPESSTIGNIEQEIRKRVWWGCFVMDRILSMKVGRPPTIQDGPGIKVGLPLPVDDEFLTNDQSGSHQPSDTLSKLEYFKQVISQCRLVDKIINTLYEGANLSEASKQREVMDTPKLLAWCTQLDGELIAWQAALPPHLKPGSTCAEWHFQRQRSVLMMRFLHAQLLIHRQTLLLCTTRRLLDPFQLEIMQCCIKRCIMAAHESIIQMRLLRRQNLLSSFWHNSHYVFAALGVLLAYQSIDQRIQPLICLDPSIDVDDTINQGLENLKQVGGKLHPLASRYVQSFQQTRSRLRAIPKERETQKRQQPQQRSRESAVEGRVEQHPGPHGLRVEDQLQQQVARNTGSQSSRLGVVDPWSPPGFGDEFSWIENMMLSSTGWPSLDDDWQ